MREGLIILKYIDTSQQHVDWFLEHDSDGRVL